MLCSLCSSIFPWYKHSMVRSELFIMFILWSNDINISSDKTQPFFALFYRLLVLGSQDLLAALQRLRQLLPGGLRSTNRDEVWPRLASCSWWNHRKTIGQWWFDGIFYGIYHLVMTNIAMDNGGQLAIFHDYPPVSSNMACWKTDHRNLWFSDEKVHW